MRKCTARPEIVVFTLATQALAAAEVLPWLALLDGEEQARAWRLAAVSARCTFIAAHVLARLALAAFGQASAAEFTFRRGAHGKPEALLAGIPAALSFSLSHTEGMAGVAVARGRLALGFDLEAARREVPETVVRRCFAASERKALEELTPRARAAALPRLWTLKEALVKATGEGLGRDLRHLPFSLTPPGLAVPGEAEAGAGWHFATRRLAGGFVAALSWRGPGRARWQSVDAAALAAAFAGVRPLSAWENKKKISIQVQNIS